MAQETPTSTHALLDMERRGLRHPITGVTPRPAAVTSAWSPPLPFQLLLHRLSLTSYGFPLPASTGFPDATNVYATSYTHNQISKLQSVTGAGALERLYVYDVWAY